MDSTHRFCHLTSLPSLFRSFLAVLARYLPRRLVCFLFPFPFSFPFSVVPFRTTRHVVLYPPRFAACAFPKVWEGMTGSDSEGAGHVSQAELATFKQDMVNEACLLYTSPSPRDRQKSRMPSSA